MATWVRQGTGTAPSTTDADLVGAYALDNAVAPADFDPAEVNSVRIQWTVTGSGFSDDSWNDDKGCALVTAGGTEISQHSGGGPTGLQNTSESNDVTDSTGIPTGLTVAQWEGASVRGDGTVIPNEWVTWVKNKGPDGSTLTVSALTVTIDYTPSSSISQAGYRVRNDDGGEAAATWRAAENTPTDVVFGTAFRVRFVLDETSAIGPVIEPRLERRIDGGAWSSPSGIDGISVNGSVHFSDGDATTRQLTSGTGTFVAGKMESSGVQAASTDLGPGDLTEYEYNIVFTSGLDVPTGGVVEFRLVQAGVDPTTFSYDQIASVTATVEAGDDLLKIENESVSASEVIQRVMGTAIVKVVTE